jgi:hypothetical protein
VFLLKLIDIELVIAEAGLLLLRRCRIGRQGGRTCAFLSSDGSQLFSGGGSGSCSSGVRTFGDVASGDVDVGVLR